MNRERALKGFRCEPTDRIPQCEYFSNPEALRLLTGIDPYLHPQKAELEMLRRYHVDVWWPALSDEPVERREDSVVVDEQGREATRWGAGTTWHWDWGNRFATLEQVLAFDPLADADYTWMEPVELDLNRTVDELAAQFQAKLDRQRAIVGDLAYTPGGFYNTLFMWPMLNFGWEHLLELGALHEAEFARLLRDFACLSRKVFQAWAKTDVEVVHSHDDICYQRGPTFSPVWLRKHIYPYYEEFWGYLKDAGKQVVFICDGNLDQVVDDVIACGADGTFAETFTDLQAYKRKHPDKVLIAGGDNRILRDGSPEDIDHMVRSMTELGRDMPGYFYCVSNHIPFDTPPEAVKLYFELCDRYGARS